jgi:probable F420-dependent oxidoreductase
VSGNLRRVDPAPTSLQPRDLGRVGIWSGVLRRGDPAEAADAAAELDELGYGALWIPGGAGGDVLGDSLRLLDATTRTVVATGILNVWMHEPADVAAGHAHLTSAHPGRFLLGLGVSHAPAVERTDQEYRRPFTKMVEYLDALDAAVPAVPHDEQVLAALGPRMLELAAQRTAGAHPYFVPPEHTAVAREVLGAGPLLATEQMVVLERDPASARAVAREHASRYLVLPNYTNNLRKLGFGDDDFAAPGSDRLIDAIVAWGDAEAIVERVRAHHDAGADHVCVQVLVADPAAFPREEWRTLAPALLDTP